MRVLFVQSVSKENRTDGFGIAELRLTTLVKISRHLDHVEGWLADLFKVDVLLNLPCVGWAESLAVSLKTEIVVIF